MAATAAISACAAETTADVAARPCVADPVEVDTSAYELEHRQTPSGARVWEFELNHGITVGVYGQYAAAARQVCRIAAERGISRVKVRP